MNKQYHNVVLQMLLLVWIIVPETVCTNVVQTPVLAVVPVAALVLKVVLARMATSLIKQAVATKQRQAHVEQLVIKVEYPMQYIRELAKTPIVVQQIMAIYLVIVYMNVEQHIMIHGWSKKQLMMTS